MVCGEWWCSCANISARLALGSREEEGEETSHQEEEVGREVTERGGGGTEETECGRGRTEREREESFGSREEACPPVVTRQLSSEVCVQSECTWLLWCLPLPLSLPP